MSDNVKLAIVSHETKLPGLLIPGNNHFNESLQSYTPLKLVCLPSWSFFCWQIQTINFNSWVKNQAKPFLHLIRRIVQKYLVFEQIKEIRKACYKRSMLYDLLQVILHIDISALTEIDT